MIIHSDGTISKLADNKLKTMQNAVGGYIEVVQLDAENLMVCNEEGIIRDLPYNTIASYLHNSAIFGDVIIMRESETGDDMRKLTDEEYAGFKAYLEETFSVGIDEV